MAFNSSSFSDGFVKKIKQDRNFLSIVLVWLLFASEGLVPLSVPRTFCLLCNNEIKVLVIVF